MSEQEIQKAVFAHLRVRHVPGTFVFHPFSGGYRKPVEAAIYKSLGAVAGLPDIFAIKDGCCLTLELKMPGGKLSASQRACRDAMAAAGATVGIAWGLDAALAWLEEHELLRGKVR